ncbi:MAG: VanZ family protein, partial [Planctomycetaceae bacterium]
MGAVLTTPVLAFLCVALPALALIFGLPSHPAILAVLNDAAHGPLFAMFAVVVTLILRRRVRWPGRWQLLAAFVAAVLAGGMVELIQPAMHRSGELADLWTDAMGALGGLAVLTLVSSHRRLVPIVTLAVAICAIG